MTPRHSILVVDDEPEVIKSLKNLLRLEYDVFGAARAVEAMEILQKQKIDVVMTDQRMPETTGAELLKNVHERYPDVMRLLITGYADVKAVIDAINKGHVYRYITKPWDPIELQTVLRDACGYHDLMVERQRLVDELQKKNAELKQASELKSAFIKVASHEFRTPVAILGALSTLAVVEQNDADALTDHLQQIGKTTERLQRLVNQTISMLSSERFDAVLRREPTDMPALLKLAADDVRPFIRIRHQEFAMELPDDLGSMSIDAEKIRDSVNHLLLNAIKFTPDRGSLAMRAIRQGDGVLIEISDTGSGIAPDSMPRLFEPFFTGFDVSKHSSGHYEHGTRGLGLGLSVVRAFTEMHGGRVAVQSELGKGSTFSIFIPQSAAAPVEAGAGI